MKTNRFAVGFCIGLTGFLLAGLSASGQMPGRSPAGLNAAMTKLFGKNSAFSAKAEVRVLDKSQQELMSTPMTFTLLDNKVRVEIDMTQMKSKDMPPGAAASLKQMGMSQVVSIIRPDLKLIYVTYPEQKCMLAMPMPNDDAEAAQRTPKIEKTALGKETIDGHACTRNKVVMSDEKGQTLQATTWEAADLRDFPVQIQTTENENTSVMHFTGVQFAKPEAKLFDPPAGYTEYKDAQEMMQAFMKRMMGGAPSAK